MKRKVTIIGSGIAGCFLAIALARRGYQVEIYERSSQTKIIDNASERSFNVTLYGYGVQLLTDAGLFDAIKPHLLQLKGSITQVGANTKPIFAPLDQEKMPYYAIQRATLLKVLLEQAVVHPNITFHFEKSLIAIDAKKKTILIHDEKTNTTSSIACDVIFGADGVHSQVRAFLQESKEATLSKEYATWTYKQIFITPQQAKKLKLHNTFAYTWTRKNAVISAFPNKDGSLNAILILPKDPKSGFASLSNKTAIASLITQSFSQFEPILPTITEQLLQNREGYFVTIHTNPWYYKDFVAILGDAAHGFNPFFGQGISAAFGDCMELMRLLDNYGPDWGKIFPLYQQSRKKHMDTMGELSKEGFIKYRRHKKADYAIIYDRLEALLHTLFPKYVAPPLFASISLDPDHTDDYFQQQQRRRKKGKYLGISLLVSIATKMLSLIYRQ